MRGTFKEPAQARLGEATMASWGVCPTSMMSPEIRRHGWLLRAHFFWDLEGLKQDTSSFTVLSLLLPPQRGDHGAGYMP